MKKFNLFIFVLVVTSQGFAQINEAPQTPVYQYLYRMAEKGKIDWNDYQLPLDRRQIFTALTQLAAQESTLSKTETRELNFYLQEYAFDSLNASTPERRSILRKDSAGRFRMLLLEKGTTKIFADPAFGASYFRSAGLHNLHSYSGLRMAGYFGEHWGFNFSYVDNTERGDTLARDRKFSSEEGIVPTIKTANLVNYGNLRYNLAYRWSNGSLSAGKDALIWGYGIGGNVILSGRAPAFPYIKFDYSPWPWLRFSYFHGWLQSNIIDSAQTYNTGNNVFGGVREIYRPKFIAHHSVSVTPVRGLNIVVGESVVYSEKLNIGYLVPISFFRALDHYASRYNFNAGDNSQFFGLVSIRNVLKNTHAYAQIFIDEIQLSTIFNPKKNRNQLGYTIGLNRTDLFFPYLTAGAEYTRINPFVYSNFISTQTYESQAYPLGDWMGNNADRLHFFLRYTPVAKLRLTFWHQNVRKGGPGTIEQQYSPAPQPPFLFGKLFTYKEVGASLNYEWLHRLVLSMKWTYSTLDYTSGITQRGNSIKIGFGYGL